MAQIPYDKIEKCIRLSKSPYPKEAKSALNKAVFLCKKYKVPFENYDVLIKFLSSDAKPKTDILYDFEGLHISIDFETYCELNLKKTGYHKYINHESFEILCFAYSINFQKTKLWIPGQKISKEVTECLKNKDFFIRGFSVGFEKEIIDTNLELFRLDKKPSVKRYIDTQALAGYFSLPLSLEKCGQVLNLNILKDKRGKYLINKLTKPKKYSKATPFTRWTRELAPLDFKDLYSYCIQDVNAEQAILKALPSMYLPKQEQIIWQHTAVQNDRGVYIDIPLVKDILTALDIWSVKTTKKLNKFTGGLIESGNQIAKFIELSEMINYPLPDLKVETVDEFLLDPKCPEKLKKLLRFRQLLSKNSTAKFNKMIEAICSDGTIKGNLQYYGTITGRYAARGIQMQNLPKLTAKNVEAIVAAFHAGIETVEKSFGNNIMALASKLIRSCLIAPPGYDLVISDYKAIENRVLHWIAGDYKTLKEFERGLDQYITFASDLYNIPYEMVNDDQRFQGKTAILGLGFQMGFETYFSICMAMGIPMTLSRAEHIVTLYRRKYRKVYHLWKRLYTAAYQCVNQGIPTKYEKIKFNFKDDRLYMVLPSNRTITYTSPKLINKKMSWGETKKVISFMGIDPYTKKWARLQISPGRLTENAVQGFARDILTTGAISAEKAGYKVCGSIHDEIYSIYPRGKADIKFFDKLICEMPEDWGSGLPLVAKGYVGPRYKKG